MKNPEQIETTNPKEIEALINRVEESQLAEGDRNLVVRLLKLVLMMLAMIENKNATISRLKRMLFGPRTEKVAKSKQEEGKTEQTKAEETTNHQQQVEKEQKATRRGGNGRLAAEQYTRAEKIECQDEKLKAGEKCPHEGCEGKLYNTNKPQKFIRLVGQPMVEAMLYNQEVLRCSSCQARFSAKLPAGVPAQKYDETADVAIATMRYGAGMPLNRIEKLQAMMAVPLPASSQFERCEVVAEVVEPVYRELQKQAANAEVIHADDTKVQILNTDKAERKGIQTTGIVARLADNDIVLYLSGHQHAGENLGDLMKYRVPELGPPIVMADAAAKNWATDFEHIMAKCLVHARRNFVEIADELGPESQRVIEDLAKVYGNDAQTREMTPQQRLAYHQQHSQPILDQLHQWMKQQLDDKQVEPNSALGAAMKYMLNHWSGLTQFLHTENAPLDNNIAERALKRVVLQRKNSLFYKTLHGATVGDTIMSVIETCALNAVNVFDYLVTLMRNASSVKLHPQQWLPWNYQMHKQQTAA